MVDINDRITQLKENYEENLTEYKEDKTDNNISLYKYLIVTSEIDSLHQKELEEEITDAEYWVDYIISENMTIDEAQKAFGLNLELVLIIKLVYASYCYIEASKASDEIISKLKYLEGDDLIQEVENYTKKTEKISYLIEVLKTYRKNQDQTNSNKKILKLKQ